MKEAFIGIIVAILLCFLLAAIMQWAWSISMSPVFNLREITYLEAMGFYVLLAASSSTSHKNE